MNWFKVFKSFRDEMTLNTWCFFNLNDHPDHTKFFMEKINVRYSLNGALGVFGPMFQISNTALTLIDQKFDLTKFIPSNKMEAAAMERGWTYIANEIGLRLNTIDGHFSHNKDDYQHKLLTKYFANRI